MSQKLNMKTFWYCKSSEFLIVLLVCSARLSLAQDQTNPGYISIDCGAPNNYVDDNLTIFYTADTGYVESGQNMQIQAKYFNQILWNQLMTLRSFPNGTRNCYTLRPPQGKNNRYLIRAFFEYGNYDNKFSRPTFDLHIDVNKWVTVSPSDNWYEEIIYTPTRDYIQVCLVNTGTGTPFISTLELRLLDNSTYPSSNAALTKWTRLNVGSNRTYRHPQDDFDRIWEPAVFSSFFQLNTTSVNLNGKNDAYRVPVEVLTTAQETLNSTYSMSLSWTSNTTDVWYIYFHFMEIQKLPVGQSRSIEISIEGNTLTTVTPEYLKPVTAATLAVTGYSAINISISSKSQSNFPPFLNAIEIYNGIALPNSQTDLNDVNAINDIKTTYVLVKRSWQGDPCSPKEYIWNGLACSQDSSPRIISLNLSSNNLMGTITNSFFNLSAVVSLDLSYNKLTGELPEYFAEMPNLRFLNLSGNDLNGSIPASIRVKMSSTLQLSLDGNPRLCKTDACTPPPSSSPEKKKNILIPVVAAVGSFIVLMPLVCTLAIIWRRRREGEVATNTRSREVLESNAVTSSKDQVSAETNATSGSKDVIGSSTQAPFGGPIVSRNQRYTSNEVLSITENFRTVIGEGGLGKVYLGTLKDGMKVAVKVLPKTSKQACKEFQAEAQLLVVVHHKNLVSLIGYCEEFETMALIYEFMPNGDLRKHLTGDNANVLSWSQRLQIAAAAAEGLEYLHNSCSPPIVHRDLKTSSILLDENMQAKIADFGLSRVSVIDSAHSQTLTRPAGTPGYIDPIFNTEGNLNQKSDVYSFGVILFELITGQPAIIKSQRDSIHIVKWVTPLIDEGDIQRIVDPRIHGQFNSTSAWKTIEIALQCVQIVPIQRPSMDRVVQDLRECLSIEINERRSQATGSSYQSSINSEITAFEMDVAPKAR